MMPLGIFQLFLIALLLSAIVAQKNDYAQAKRVSFEYVSGGTSSLH